MKVWRRETAHFIVGGVVVLLLAVAGWFIINNFQSKTTIRLESGVFQLSLATDQPSRDKNLSNRTSLEANGGILLAYPDNDRWQIATRSIHVAVDIIWLDEQKKVVHIVRDVSTESDSDMVYTPQKEARYVIEIPAGKAKESGVKIGSQAVFTIDEAKIE